MPKRIPPTLEQLSNDTKSFFTSINDESDLVVALLCANYLDSALGSTIRRRLKPGKVTDSLLESRGALGSFAARIDFSYSLGSLTAVVYMDLRIIGEIRNLFAIITWLGRLMTPTSQRRL
jgi:hypothetical protein